jgi:hypothetical protein
MPQIQSTPSHRISLNVYFNIILPFASRPSKYFPPEYFQTAVTYMYHTSHDYCKVCPSHPPMKNIKSGISHEVSNKIFYWFLSAPLLPSNITLSRTTSICALVSMSETNAYQYNAIRFEITVFLTLWLRNVFKLRINCQ